jgi:hypothetical protein
MSRRSLPSRATGLGLVLAATVLALAACSTAPASSAGPSVAPPSGATPAATPPAAPAPTAAASATAGGPLAAAVVAKLAADPLILHLEQVATAKTTVNQTEVSADVTLSGDLDGADMALTIKGTSGGQALDQEIVVVGDKAYVRQSGGPWSSAPRSVVASTLTNLVTSIRLVSDPADLREVGVETIEGRSLHHLTASRTIPYAPAAGGTGQYDVFDIWVQDDGTPVIAKTAFSATATGGTKASGTTDFRFTNVGGPIDIVAPSVAPSAAP